MKYKAVISSRADRLIEKSSKKALPLRPGCEDYKHLPSVELGTVLTSKIEPLVYSGDVVIGIATMHKSNAVPVTSTSQAIDIAKMRRS